MIGVATLILAIGVADLVRTATSARSRSRTTLSMLVGLGIGLLAWLWLDHPSQGGWAWLMGAAALIGWIWLSRAAVSRTGHPTTVAAFALGAAASLFVGLASMVLAGDVAGTWPRHHLSWTDSPFSDPDRALLVTALLIAQLSTANIVVRMTLSAAGVPAESNENTVKGGRWLGPMERIFILGFGAAGEFTAASAVVAAKALLRLPEVNAGDDDADKPGARARLAEHSEYLLLGSFASWLFAAASIGLTLVYG
jgi:hypothetical protein